MNQLVKTQHASVWATLAASAVVLFLGAGCGNESTASESDVATSYQELAGELAACAQANTDCLTAAGTDAAAQAACASQLTSCQDGAKAKFEQLKADLQACFDAAKGCVGTADAGAGLRACGEQLRECVKTSLPTPPCFADLQACVQNGGSAQDCGAQVHACIKANLPGHGGFFGAFGNLGSGFGGAHHDDSEDGGCDKGEHDGFGGFGAAGSGFGGFAPRGH